MLEILANAHEVLDGSGDGKQFYASIETLSRKTLGQLLHTLRKRAEIRPDIDDQLSAALEARNFVVHRFAESVGDDLADEDKIFALQRSLSEKCMIIVNANSTAAEVLRAIGHLNAERSYRAANELRDVAATLRELGGQTTQHRSNVARGHHDRAEHAAAGDGRGKAAKHGPVGT